MKVIQRIRRSDAQWAELLEVSVHPETSPTAAVLWLLWYDIHPEGTRNESNPTHPS